MVLLDDEAFRVETISKCSRFNLFKSPDTRSRQQYCDKLKYTRLSFFGMWH